LARVEDGNVEMIESMFEKALMVDARTSTETSGVTAAYFPFLIFSLLFFFFPETPLHVLKLKMY